MLAAGRLKVVGRDFTGEYDVRGVRRSLRIANTPRWLYLPGGGACVTADNDAVDRMTVARRYERVRNFTDLPDITLQQIQHFFEHYKDLEPGKWVKIDHWGDADEARRLISEAMVRAIGT